MSILQLIAVLLAIGAGAWLGKWFMRQFIGK